MAVEQLELESRPPLTVDEFEALAERQGWNEATPVELRDGELIWMRPTNDPHIGCVNRLNRLFNRRYSESIVLVSIQKPEQENIRAVLRWAEQRRPEVGLRIVGALWLWYFLSFREGHAWAERLP